MATVRGGEQPSGSHPCPPLQTHRTLTGHRCTGLWGRQFVTTGRDVCVSPDPQDPCPAPWLPHASLVGPRISRSRGSLQGWGSRGTDERGGDLEKGLRTPGGSLVLKDSDEAQPPARH